MCVGLTLSSYSKVPSKLRHCLKERQQKYSEIGILVCHTVGIYNTVGFDSEEAELLRSC